MAHVLLERETVEGEAVEALLNNTWEEYVSHEGALLAEKEARNDAAEKLAAEKEQQAFVEANGEDALEAKSSEN